MTTYGPSAYRAPACRPSAAELLALWDSGQGHTPEDQALTLLSVAESQPAHEGLAALSLGERDRRLLRLRAELFGDPCEVFAVCPRCGTAQEFSFAVSSLLQPDQSAPFSEEVMTSDEVRSDGMTVRFRLPDSTDLAAVRSAENAGLAKQVLLERCTIFIHDGAAEERVTRNLAEALLPRFEAWLEQRGPSEDLSLDIACVSCGEGWPLLFDVPRFLWSELDRAARLLLEEVGALARVFGWSEAAILSLSPVRRAAYLEMVR